MIKKQQGDWVGESMLKIALCDDEEIQARQIIKVIRKCGHQQEIEYQVDYFKSGTELLKQNIDEYELIILDIQIDEMTGIEIAGIIRETNQKIKIMFITAHQQYWPEGYKVLASRYLLKPISDQRLCNELMDIFEEIRKSKLVIMATKDKSVAKVMISDIKYLEISGRKVLIHTQDDSYCSNNSLAYWYRKLKVHHFAYTHSSYLVNMKYVKLVERDKVTLITGDEVYMSLRKYKPFKMTFIQYISQI